MLKCNKIKKICLILISMLLSIVSYTQDMQYMEKIIDKLSSDEMAGRAYSCKGGKKASNFIANELKKLKVSSIEKSYFQNYSYSTTDFRKTPELYVDGNKLKPAVDFYVTRQSLSVKGIFNIFPLLNDSVYTELSHMNLMLKGDKSKVVLTDSFHNELKNLGYMTFAGTIFKTDNEKLYWEMPKDETILNTFTIVTNSDLINENSKQIDLRINNRKVFNFKTRNVIGVIPSNINSDRYLMVGAHYDHLGKFGDITLPGANDNASGVATILTLIKHLYENKTNITFNHNLIFVFFSGKEAGLKGSLYFANNPPIELDKIDFFINLDAVGGNSEGITIVQGTEYPLLMEKVKEINSEKEYFSKIDFEGKSYDSDHAPLFAKGVPAVLIHTNGSDSTEYHNIYDTSEKIKLNKGKELIRFLTDFLLILDAK